MRRLSENLIPNLSKKKKKDTEDSQEFDDTNSSGDNKKRPLLQRTNSSGSSSVLEQLNSLNNNDKRSSVRGANDISGRVTELEEQVVLMNNVLLQDRLISAENNELLKSIDSRLNEKSCCSPCNFF